jgi:hypothetical protein
MQWTEWYHALIVRSATTATKIHPVSLNSEHSSYIASAIVPVLIVGSAVFDLCGRLAALFDVALFVLVCMITPCVPCG